MTQDNSFHFVSVDKKLTLDYIKLAKKRILIAKPGYYVEEIEAIKNIIETTNCSCQLFIEEGDNPVRYGLGEVEALKKIRELIGKLGFTVADSIRLSLILIDDIALFYVPTTLKWEEEKDADKLNFPNGIMITGPWVDWIHGIYLSNIASAEVPSNIIPFKNCPLPPIDSQESKAKNDEAIEKLEKEKPIDPTSLKKFRFYKNNYKIVKVTCIGTNISRKSISLDKFNKLFRGNLDRLRARWNAISKEDAEELSNKIDLKKEIENIKKSHDVIPAGRFGGLIKKENRIELEKSLSMMEESIKTPARRDKKRNIILEEIDSILLKSRNELISYLIRQITSDESNFIKYNLFFPFPPEARNLDYFVVQELKFPSVQDIVRSISIKVDIYDISDELLQSNEDFQKILSENIDIPKKLRSYGEGYKEEKPTHDT